MKVTGPGQIKTAATKKTGKSTGSGGAAFSAAIATGEGDGVAAAGNAQQTAPLAPIDALLALQEMPDAAVGRSKGLARANDMLDLLEDVRRGILLGAISQAKLRHLADLVRSRTDSFTDPRLAAILGDIELRAEVEIAKLESKF